MKSNESEEGNHKVQSSNLKPQSSKEANHKVQSSNFKVQTEQLKTKFDRMMSALYEQRGAQLNISILGSDEAQDFINAHASLLDSTFQPVKMSQKMRERLQRSDYVFSGLKTFHELNEAFPSLIDENGDRKPFERFLNDVRRIDETYNAHYLRAEYDFVHSSALMAAKWEQYAEDGDRYLLQYRTAHDDKVRPEHAALDRVTLPMSDPFWESYYPPNGWNCRCTVERVLRGKYRETPHQEAMQRGDEALNGERYNIFRFNSGMQQKTMPPYNPYTIRRCNDCDIAKGKGVELAFVPENELCAACKMLQQCAGDRTKSQRAIERKHYLDKEMAHLLQEHTEKQVSNNETIKVRFDKYGNKHLLSDTFGRSQVFSREDLTNINDILKGATFIGEADRDTARSHSNPYEHFYYFKAILREQPIRLNVGKLVKTNSRTGRTTVKYILYSVNDIHE